MLMALFLGKYLLNVLVSDVPGWTASFFFPWTNFAASSGWDVVFWGALDQGLSHSENPK